MASKQKPLKSEFRYFQKSKWEEGKDGFEIIVPNDIPTFNIKAGTKMPALALPPIVLLTTSPGMDSYKFWGVQLSVDKFMECVNQKSQLYFVRIWLDMLIDRVSEAVWCHVFSQSYYVEKQKEPAAHKVADEKQKEFLNNFK